MLYRILCFPGGFNPPARAGAAIDSDRMAVFSFSKSLVWSRLPNTLLLWRLTAFDILLGLTLSYRALARL